MMRLLHRWADTQLRRDNEHRRRALRTALEIGRSLREQRDAYREDAARWRSIATDRAKRITELEDQ